MAQGFRPTVEIIRPISRIGVEDDIVTFRIKDEELIEDPDNADRVLIRIHIDELKQALGL